MLACAFGVKCHLMFILLCVGTQIALLSLIDCTKLPLYTHFVSLFKDMGPFNKLGCSLVCVTVDYCCENWYLDILFK